MIVVRINKSAPFYSSVEKKHLTRFIPSEVVGASPATATILRVIMRPLHNKVLVERIAAEKISAGGIVLQRTDGPDKAKILAIGPDVKEVSVGEVALINWNMASKAQDETFIISEDNIVLVFEDENE